MPRSGITGSYGNSIFNYFRNCHIVSRGHCTILHSHQQSKRVLISPHQPHQQVTFVIFFNNIHLNEYKVVTLFLNHPVGSLATLITIFLLLPSLCLFFLHQILIKYLLCTKPTGQEDKYGACSQRGNIISSGLFLENECHTVTWK